ncbi:UvrD-helicase domain-containing protein [Nocardia cyriacigeorgica]|uniref:UvrD-helicase domain-containing protein n=1 Tax=Nocardia cyriacigeorgica TaxID=135487 RepID=UPI0024563713|nr:UvrD-helicase domain-containing protein [Nocardia cyriacigeorgica]
MAKLVIDKDFLLDLGALETTVQRNVRDVFAKFAASTHTGLHLEKLRGACNDRYRSIRINQFMRGIVLAPTSGDTYVLLKVLPHDDAYAWAARRDVSVNPAFGVVEIWDGVGAAETLAALPETPPQDEPRLLFADYGDAVLRRLGIDERVLKVTRSLTEKAQLEAVKEFLPDTQWQVLSGLAEGFTPDQVWELLAAELTAEPIDPDDLDAAIERSGYRLVAVDGPEELLAILERPLDFWRVYLHPTQRAVADATYRGPARVTGGPGTGKTVVALHRAHALAKRNEGRVLLTTFTSTLADILQAGMNLLVDDDAVRRRIEIVHVDRLANRIFRRHRKPPHILTQLEERQIWASVIRELELPFTPAFLSEDWREVILAQRIQSADQYLASKRRGRGRAMSAQAKAGVWMAISHFEKHLADTKRWTHETVRREAVRIMETVEDPIYRHVLVDEAQDLSPDQWRLLRACVPAASDDLFLAGDTHQRIYQNRVTLKDVGIQVAGRSTRLTVNYRTTAEILRWSLELLRGERIDDMDEGLESIAGCRSDLHGPDPVVRGFTSAEDELAHMVEVVRSWIERGAATGEIGIATRAKDFGAMARAALRNAGISVVDLATATEGGVGVGTMHRMKGLEFRYLAVLGVGEEQVPPAAAITSADEDPHAYQRDLQRERCLLFVACTRAREELVVTWHGSPSDLLPEASNVERSS